jgi:hypothetical protein
LTGEDQKQHCQKKYTYAYHAFEESKAFEFSVSDVVIFIVSKHSVTKPAGKVLIKDD